VYVSGGEHTCTSLFVCLWVCICVCAQYSTPLAYRTLVRHDSQIQLAGSVLQSWGLELLLLMGW